MFRRILVSTLALAAVLAVDPPRSSGASKEIQELQRDVAQLQDMVRSMQRSQDEKFATLQTLVQQSLGAATDAGKTAAIIQNGFQQNIRELETKVVAPVVGLGSRVDQVASDTRTLQQAVADLTALMTKLQSQLTDLNNAVKVMQAPPPPPPGQGGMSPTGSPSTVPGAESGERPSISSTELMANANRDRMAGKMDLSLAEYSDYLKYYGNTDMAPVAQYQIAWIHFSQNDFDTALREFDMVLEKYPDNTRTADAMYYKGMSLLRLNRRTDAANEFVELIKRFPRTDLATKSCDQLKSLGRNCPVTRAAAPSRGAAKRRK